MNGNPNIGFAIVLSYKVGPIATKKCDWDWDEASKVVGVCTELYSYSMYDVHW